MTARFRLRTPQVVLDRNEFEQFKARAACFSGTIAAALIAAQIDAAHREGLLENTGRDLASGKLNALKERASK